MANEISIIAKLTASKGGSSVTNATSTKSVDMTGANMVSDVLTLAIATQTLVPVTGVVDTTANYHLLIYSAAANTNYIEVYTDLDAYAAPLSRIYPGQFFFPGLMVGGVDIKLKAITTTADVNIVAVEV